MSIVLKPINDISKTEEVGIFLKLNAPLLFESTPIFVPFIFIVAPFNISETLFIFCNLPQIVSVFGGKTIKNLLSLTSLISK